MSVTAAGHVRCDSHACTRVLSATAGPTPTVDLLRRTGAVCFGWTHEPETGHDHCDDHS